jgi:chorismate synthase
MNAFGTLFRVALFGESHGPRVGTIVDGCPAGLRLDPTDLLPDLARRRGGAIGTTARVEADLPEIESGVHRGRTTGAPILIAFANGDARPEAYAEAAKIPRPGHADWAARLRHRGFNDPRGGGHFSGRLTVGLVAAGAIAKKLLAPAEVHARLLEAGGRSDFEAAAAEAVAARDSIGGVVECRATGISPGLGEPFFDGVEAGVAHALFSIPGVKGVEFGAGFAGARMRGSAYNDAILDASGRTETNRAGGLNGGLTNGNEIVVRLAVRPAASIGVPQRSVNLETGTPAAIVTIGRHDPCIALRVPVIAEAAVAVALADYALMACASRRAVGGYGGE